MAIKHFRASEHSPSALKVEDNATMTTIDQIHAQSANEGNRLLPTVFTVEKGDPVTAKAAGPIAIYVIEGEFLAEVDEKPLHLTSGDVVLVDEGTVYKFSTSSKGRGFAVAYVPAPLVLKDLQIK